MPFLHKSAFFGLFPCIQKQRLRKKHFCRLDAFYPRGKGAGISSVVPIVGAEREKIVFSDLKAVHGKAAAKDPSAVRKRSVRVAGKPCPGPPLFPAGFFCADVIPSARFLKAPSD